MQRAAAATGAHPVRDSLSMCHDRLGARDTVDLAALARVRPSGRPNA